MNFIARIIETYKKGILYDELWRLYSELVELNEGNVDNIVELITKNNLLKNEINSLLEEDKIDVLDLKDYYEGKYGSKIWLYPYDGKISRDAKGALVVDDEEKLRRASEMLVNKYGLSKGGGPTRVVEVVMSYFIDGSQWTYTRDSKLFDLGEYWNNASSSWDMREGDCDDLAILMHSLVYYIFEKLDLTEHYWRIKLTAGGTIKEGHAFNIWLGDDGEWYVVESTLDLRGSFNKTWLKTPIRYNNLYTSFWGFARRDRSWKGSSSSLLPSSG